MLKSTNLAELRRAIEVVRGAGSECVPVHVDVLRKLINDAEQLQKLAPRKTLVPG